MTITDGIEEVALRLKGQKKLYKEKEHRVQPGQSVKKVTCYSWAMLAACMTQFNPAMKRFAAGDTDHNVSTNTFMCREMF